MNNEEFIFNLVTPLETWTTLTKVYSINEKGETVSNFNPGTYFTLYHGITEKDFEEHGLGIFEEAHRKAKNYEIMMLPNLPPWLSSTVEKFTRTDLNNAPRPYFQADIEWTENIPEEILKGNLKNKSEYILKELGFPEDLGFFATYSTSAEVKPNELRVRLWFLLCKSMNEEELRSSFSGVGKEDRRLDLGMCEKERIHILKPAKIKSGVKKTSLPFPDFYRREGCKLDVTRTVQTPREEVHRTATGNAGAYKNDTASIIPYLSQELKSKYISWHKWDLINAACIELAAGGEFNGRRNNWFYVLFTQCCRCFGTGYLAYETITNNESILGTWGLKEVKAKQQYVEAAYLNKLNCGNIETIIPKQNLTKVSVSYLTDIEELIQSKFPSEGLVCVKSPEGTRKTNALLAWAAKTFGSESCLVVSHRKSIVGQHTREIGGENYKDVGLNDPEFCRESERTRKELLCPDIEHLNICDKSLQYLEVNGKIKKKDLVIIDESESVAMNFCIFDQYSVLGKVPARLEATRKQYKILFELCSTAKLVIFTDADLSAVVTGYFAKRIADNSEKELHAIINDKDFIEDMSFALLPNGSYILPLVKKLLGEGKKIALQTSWGNKDSKPQIDAFVKTIKNYCELTNQEIKGYWSKSSEWSNKENVRDTPTTVIPRMIDEGLKVLVMSPVNNTGWSYWTPEDKYDFDATINVYENDNISACTIKQGFRRYRKTKKHYFHIHKKKNKDLKYVHDSDWTDKINILDEFDKYEKVLQYASNVKRLNVREHFINLIEDKGGVFFDFDTSSYSNEEIDEAKILYKKANAQIKEIKSNLAKDKQLYKKFVKQNGSEFTGLEIDDSAIQTMANLDEKFQKINIDEVIAFMTSKVEDVPQRNSFVIHCVEVINILIYQAAEEFFKPYIDVDYSCFLEWLLRGDKDLEIFLDGIENSRRIDAILNNLKDKIKELKVLKLETQDESFLVSYEDKPLTIIKKVANSLALDCRTFNKKGGKTSDGKQLTVKLEKDVYELYKKKSWISEKIKGVYRIKNELRRLLIKRKKEGKRLLKEEIAYYPCIGKRIIIRRPKYYHKKLYNELLCLEGYFNSFKD